MTPAVTDERVAGWRLRTQGLTEPVARTATEVVAGLLAVQAENPSQSGWAVASRTPQPRAADLASLLQSGEVVRTHVLRSTWHYVARADIDWLELLTVPRLRPLVERGLTVGAGLDASAVDRLAAGVDELLAREPDRIRAEVAAHLQAAHPDLAGRLTGQAMLYLMAWCELERLVISGVPRGTGPTDHTYARWEDRVGPPADAAAFDREAALAQVALRYVTGHGPVTAEDLGYWATLPIGEVRRGLAAASDLAGPDGLRTFEHDGRTYWYGGEPPALDGTPRPRGHLLQLLDEIYRGYQDSRWVLDAAGVVPRGREAAIGIALVDGQLVSRMRRTLGPWKVRFDLEPYRPLSSPQRNALEEAARRYGEFLGLTPELRIVV